MQFKLLFALLLTASFAAGQNTGDRPNLSDPNVAGPASTPGDDPLSSFQAVNASIDTVLQQYEQLTGRILIKDSNLSAHALPITISLPQPVPKSELIRLI